MRGEASTEAIPRLREALKAGVRVNLAGYDLARALAAAGDRAGALQTLQAMRPESPPTCESWNALGQLAMQLESPSLAAAFFNDAVAAVAACGAAASGSRAAPDAMMGRHARSHRAARAGVALDPAIPRRS